MRTVMVQDLEEFNSILEVLFDASVCRLINMYQGKDPSIHILRGLTKRGTELWKIQVIIMDIWKQEELW
jgi:hypothetical protein